MSTVSLALIARNAADTLGPAIDSIKDHVDEIVIVLGGKSTDDTENVARRYTDKVFPFKWCDDFSAARQFSFAQCTPDWIFWIDSDDLVVGAEHFREVVAEAEEKGLGAVILRYAYQKDDNGNVLTEHNQTRLLRRDLNWFWGCPCMKHAGRVHEVCMTEAQHTRGESDKLYVDHTRRGGEHLVRNMRLMELMQKENPSCPRTMLAMGHGYFGLGDYPEALHFYTAYYVSPESELERWHAAVFAAKCCWQMGRWGDLANWGMIAINSYPELQDGYLLMAQAEWWANKDAARTLTWLQSANEKMEAPLAVFRNPQDYQLNRWDVEHRAYAALEMWTEAGAIVRQALELVPGDKRWIAHLRLYEEAARSDKTVHAVIQHVDHLVRHGDILKAASLLDDHLPHSIETDRRVGDMQARVHSMLGHLNGGGPDPHTELSEGARRVTWNSAHLALMPRVQYVERRVEELGVKRVLDIGCQTGALAIRLAKLHGCEVVGVDSSEEAIKIAKKRAKQAKAKVDFRCEDARQLHEQDVGHFDLAIALEIIEHLPGSEAQRLLGLMDDLADTVIVSSAAELIPTRPGLEDMSPRDHVRQFSMGELWQLIAKRPDRRVHNLYKLYDEVASEDLALPGFGTWIGEYDLKQTDQPRVVIYCGPGLERWSPLQIETTGLGGSETGAVKLAEQFAKRGLTVVVYAEWEGFCNGVIYRPASEFRVQAPFFGQWPAWLMIGSRVPSAALGAAQHRWLWLHDTDCRDELTEEIAEALDRVVVLSEWHKAHVLERYPFLSAEKLLVIGDGLIEEFLPKLERPKRHSFIYSSSPDRGLDVLLGWWPSIREMWPDAELSVYYGWENFDRMAQRFPQMVPFKRKIMAILDQPGVTVHGRIGQRELYQRMAETQFWLYPSIQMDGADWHETYCITALEAQGCGVIPLTRPVGALSERVAGLGLVDSRDVGRFLTRLRELDKGDAKRGQRVLELRRQTWGAVARQWWDAAMADERQRLLGAPDEDKVPEYA